MKTLFITAKPISGRKLVQNLSRMYVAEQFEDFGNYVESDSYIVTWTTGHLFRISNDPAASVSREEVLSQIDDMSGNETICPDWEFETIDVSEKERFEVLKSLINSPNVGAIVHAGDDDPNGEIIIRLILHMASSKKPVLRLALLSHTYDELASKMSRELMPIFSSNWLAKEGFLNMIMNYWRGNTHFCQGNAPANQVPSSPEEHIAQELRKITDGYCCSQCKQREACKDVDSITGCNSFTPNRDFLHRLKYFFDCMNKESHHEGLS